MKRVFVAAAVAMILSLSTHSARAFRDDFNTLDTADWTVYNNGGSVYVNNGSLIVSQSGSKTTCPYLYLNSDPFPQSGNFVLTMGITFTSLNAFGCGICAGVPVPPNLSDPSLWSPTVFSYWADNTRSAIGTTYHTLQYYYYGASIQTFMDGQPCSNHDNMQLWSLNRPQALWIGNPGVEPFGAPWSSMAIDYIDIEPVPEPSSVLALLCGLGSIGGLVCRRKRNIR